MWLGILQILQVTLQKLPTLFQNPHLEVVASVRVVAQAAHVPVHVQDVLALALAVVANS